MDYVIKNPKNVFIQLDENGRPVTCTENNKGIFEYSKACNICNHLPKTLKKLKFCVEAIYETQIKTENKVINEEDKLRDEYNPSENVTRWVEKFGICDDILSEAILRKDELLNNLKKSDDELMDILHVIEIEKPKDLFSGWKLYKRIRENRKNRRDVKDELLIVNNVLNRINNTYSMKRSEVQKAINGLYDRKYSFRIIDDRE